MDAHCLTKVIYGVGTDETGIFTEDQEEYYKALAAFRDTLFTNLRSLAPLATCPASSSDVELEPINLLPRMLPSLHPGDVALTLLQLKTTASAGLNATAR